MKNSPEWLALQQAYAVCGVHDEALRDALGDLKQRRLVASDLDSLGKEDRRLERFERLQLALSSAQTVTEIFQAMGVKIRERFTGIGQ